MATGLSPLRKRRKEGRTLQRERVSKWWALGLQSVTLQHKAAGAPRGNGWAGDLGRVIGSAPASSLLLFDDPATVSGAVRAPLAAAEHLRLWQNPNPRLVTRMFPALCPRKPRVPVPAAGPGVCRQHPPSPAPSTVVSSSMVPKSGDSQDPRVPKIAVPGDVCHQPAGAFVTVEYSYILSQLVGGDHTPPVG